VEDGPLGRDDRRQVHPRVCADDPAFIALSGAAVGGCGEAGASRWHKLLSSQSSFAWNAAPHRVEVRDTWRVYDSMVARLEPEADESVGEPIPSLEEGVPAQDRVTVNDGRMVGLTRGVGGEEIHGHHCTIRLHRPVGVVAACGS
jgi:hypothetical protein